MKRIISSALAIVMAMAGVALMPVPSYAEDEDVPATWLQISPTAATITLAGGDVITGKGEDCPEDFEEGCAVEVKNIGGESFSYRVYASPYVVNNENGLDFSEESSTSYTQLSRWITFLDDSGNYVKEVQHRIAPGETQLIQYRIDVPEDVPGGSQYAVIWAQTLPNSTSGSGVQAISQAGTVISGRSIGNTRQSAEVFNYDFTRFTFGGSLKAAATIKNTGNTDFDAYYFYTAKTLFGKELYSDNGTVSAFPDTEHNVELIWENTPLLGIFQVEFKISAADTEVSESHIVMIMPVFIMILLILLLTVIIIWIIIIIRKRKERKARTLV